MLSASSCWCEREGLINNTPHEEVEVCERTEAFHILCVIE